MWDLRWVLLGLGALLVVGLYFWSKGTSKRGSSPSTREQRAEPSLGDERPEPASEESVQRSKAAAHKPSRSTPERIVALRLIPRHDELSAGAAVHALRDAGLQHGRYGIFHKLAGSEEPVFSVASLTEPGSFDLTNLTDATIAGLSFFIVLPGTTDPVNRFDAMIESARSLAVELDSDLHDAGGSSWSIQRERYVREELIEYRHQLERR
jgi:cell division protein ZipA